MPSPSPESVPSNATRPDIEGAPELQRAFEAFVGRFPEFSATGSLDRLRSTQYRRLDDQGHVYLDYTGGSLYSEKQLDEHLALLRAGVFGNPHSTNPTSTAMTALIERTRHEILDYFHTSAENYVVVFTQNASGALKLVGESFSFQPGSRLLLTFDNHNSVNGIREFARQRGATVTYAPLRAPELRLDRDRLDALLTPPEPGCESLFAFPAQSNFSGVKHPLDLVVTAQSRGWRVLLDAAAFVPTNRLDLGKIRPEFVTVSFYKMFGYPTGLGALLIHRDALSFLRRPWFAGGTVNFASVQAMAHVLAPNEAAFEDGTINYLSIPAVEIGLRHLKDAGVEIISERIRCLTGWLLEQLLALRHGNGHPLVRIYGPVTTEARGGTVTLNLYDPDGHLLDYRRVEELAGEQNISVRSGCFCNPGAGEIAEGLTEDDMLSAYALGNQASLQSFARLMQDRGHKSAGALRASLGIVSNFADVWRFVNFIASFRDQTMLAIGAVTFDIESCRVVRDGS